MHSQYRPLFRPYQLNNGVTVKNRFVVAPMTHYASHADGRLSEAERLFLGNRAQGFGMFITASTLVSAEGKSFLGEPHALGAHDLPSLRAVARLIQAQGALAILQLHHGGAAVAQVAGVLDAPVIPAGMCRLAPGDDPSTGARAASEAEIQALVAAFARAAELAIQAGFDGVEIHGANGYLLQQFFSARTNRRTDRWGGRLQARMRFPLAVVEAVCAARARWSRPDFIVGYRFSPEESGERGLTMTDTLQLVDALAQAPLQYLHLSMVDFYRKVRRGADPALPRIRVLHEYLAGRLPLIGVGGLLGAEQILAAYQSGWAEFIALGKAVMLNPDLVSLVASGREQEMVMALDPARADRYGLPELLWRLCLLEQDWLPPLMKKAQA